MTAPAKKWPGPKPRADDARAEAKKVSDAVWRAKREEWDAECFVETMAAVRGYEQQAMDEWKAGAW